MKGLWLDVVDFDSGKRRSMRKTGNPGSWSDNEDSDNGLMCVFFDYTDLSETVCTTVSLKDLQKNFRQAAWFFFQK